MAVFRCQGCSSHCMLFNPNKTQDIDHPQMCCWSGNRQVWVTVSAMPCDKDGNLIVRPLG